MAISLNLILVIVTLVAAIVSTGVAAASGTASNGAAYNSVWAIFFIIAFLTGLYVTYRIYKQDGWKNLNFMLLATGVLATIFAVAFAAASGTASNSSNYNAVWSVFLIITIASFGIPAYNLYRMGAAPGSLKLE